MPKPENIEPHKWQEGQSGNPAGRPRKWVSTLKAQGYKKSEINDCISVLISMGEKELNEVADNEDATVLERVVAKALLESMRKKTLYNIETLITRVHGQPKQETEETITIKKFDVKFNEEPKQEDGNNL